MGDFQKDLSSMKHPLLQVTPGRRLPIFALFFALTIATMIALNISGRPLTTGVAPSGIVFYEFAGDVTTAAQIIDSWDSSARIAAGFNLGLDYLYLLLYSTTIAMALLWLSDGLAIGWLATLAITVAWLQWLAAGLDAVENYGLFRMLVDVPVDPWPQVAWWCAAVKFALVIIGLVLVLVLATIRAGQYVRRKY
jgi:hypothetical protein